MSKRRFPAAVAALALVLAWSIGSSARPRAGHLGEAPPAQGFVGAQACASCHAAVADTWTRGRHSKMIQPATPASVSGDFSTREVTLGGLRYRLRVANGEYFITESYLTDHEREHRVEYTLGSRRIQHYLATIENGRVIVLPPSWDVQRHEWFDNMEIVRPDEKDEKAGKLFQQWNRSCVGCHVSQQENNYRHETRTYATTWLDFGTSCERCHGPGAAHVAVHTANGRPETPAASAMVRPTRLDPAAATAVCAQCHTLRDVIAPGYAAGADYYDFFQPVLEYAPRSEKDPAYWADGRPRRFSNDALGLWQSECFVRGGATCTSCHADPHLPNIEVNPQLAPANNALCTGCHDAIGASVTEHTRHRPESAGSACLDCHMPRTVVSIRSTMRDHTMSVPAPENTVALGIPNACSECHRDKTAAWAVDAVRAWWPRGRRSKMIERAQTFTAARAKRPEALDRLLKMLSDDTQPPLVRANAAGYLAGYPGARSAAALRATAAAAHPALRAVALSTLGSLARESGEAPATFARALADPKRAVRLAALIALVNAAGGPLGQEDQSRFRLVTEELTGRARLHQEDAGIQRDFGVAKLLAGEFDAAAAALGISADLNPERPSTLFFLAMARLGQGRTAEAQTLFQRVPPADPYYAAARDRLKRLDVPRVR